MSNPFPHEFELYGVYLSPILVVAILALFATLITTFVLNKVRVAHYIWYPQLAFVAIFTLYVLLIDAYYITI